MIEQRELGGVGLRDIGLLEFALHRPWILATIDAADFESQLVGARADAVASEQAVVEVRASLESLRASAPRPRLNMNASAPWFQAAPLPRRN